MKMIWCRGAGFSAILQRFFETIGDLEERGDMMELPEFSGDCLRVGN